MTHPQEVAGLAVWFKAADLGGLADGANIGGYNYWVSAVGNARGFNDVVDRRPKKETVDEETVIRFLGDGDSIEFWSPDDMLTVTKNIGSCTVFVKAKINTIPVTTQGQLVSISTGTDNAQGRITSRILTDGTFGSGGRRLDTDSNVVASGGAPGITDIHVFTSVFDWANNSVYGYIDGVEVASNTNWQTAGTTSNTDSLAASLGARSDNIGAESIAADLYDALIYEPALNSTDQAGVEDYLLNPPPPDLISQPAQGNQQFANLQ